MDKGSKDGFWLTGAIGFESSCDFDRGIGPHYGALRPLLSLIQMNFNGGSEDEELTDSSSDNDYSKKSRMETDEGLYEEVSDSDIDEKEHLNRMNDTGVVDVTYAQRTVWLVKVN